MKACNNHELLNYSGNIIEQFQLFVVQFLLQLFSNDIKSAIHLLQKKKSIFKRQHVDSVTTVMRQDCKVASAKLAQTGILILVFLKVFANLLNKA